ncbi:MAG: hypothetical protein N2037_02605 [Acidimicrobiales bacterium]|nr:hypothetical protein [Acidimicrobiales bacterium]
MLADGRYDAFIVDATIDNDRVTHLELTIVAGAHKGEVVSLSAQNLAGEEFDLIGMPATITVVNGTPHVQIDR